MTRVEELQYLRCKLKQGDYDGTDIMQAWLAIDELIKLEEKNETYVLLTTDNAWEMGGRSVLHLSFYTDDKAEAMEWGSQKGSFLSYSYTTVPKYTREVEKDR